MKRKITVSLIAILLVISLSFAFKCLYSKTEIDSDTESANTNNQNSAQNIKDKSAIYNKTNSEYAHETKITDTVILAEKYINTDAYLYTGIVTDKGEEIHPFISGEIVPIYHDDISETRFFYVNPSKENPYIIDLSGNKVLTSETKNGLSLQSDCCPVKVDGGVYYQYDYNCNLVRKIDSNIQIYTQDEDMPVCKTVMFNGKGLKYGAQDKDNNTIVSCEYDEIFIYKDIIVARKGAGDGLEENDTAVLFDVKGNSIIPEGKYLRFSFNEKSEYGVAAVNAENNTFKFLLIDKKGNEKSKLYDEIYFESGKYIGLNGESKETIQIN